MFEVKCAHLSVLVHGVDDDGELVLGGLEYVVPKQGPYAEEPPDLFDYDWGGEFRGEDSPAESMWTLHAWVHARNPAGTFAPFNPDERFHPEGCMGPEDH